MRNAHSRVFFCRFLKGEIEMRRALVLAVLAAIVFQFTGVLPACVPAEGRVFVDSVGREVEVPDEIVSVAPSGPLAQIAL